MKFFLNLEKILQDNKQDPMLSYKILEEFYGILVSSGKEPPVLRTRSFEILQDPRESYKIVQDRKQNPMESLTILDKML